MIHEKRWDWTSLTTLSIPAVHLIPHIEALTAQDSDDRHRAGALLYCELANQGELYSAAAACVDFLADHLVAGGCLNAECIELIEAILEARSPGLTVNVRGEGVEVEEFCRNRVLEVLPLILECVEGEDLEYFREVCFLIPPLADSSAQVVGFLRASVVRYEGEWLRVCSEALVEAEEVVRG